MKSLTGIPSSLGTIPPALPLASEFPRAKSGATDCVSVQPTGWTCEPGVAATYPEAAFAGAKFCDVAFTGATPPR